MAGKEKTAMMFYHNWLNIFDEMDDSEIGQLVMAALRYDMTGEDTHFSDKYMRVAFRSLKNSIDITAVRSKSAQESASKRWECDAESKDAPHNSEMRRINDECDASADDARREEKRREDKIREEERREDKIREEERRDVEDNADTAPQPRTEEYQNLIREWNSIPHATKIREIIPLSKRDNELRLLLSHYGWSGVYEGLHHIRDSEYLKKRGSVSFDSYMTTDVFQKVLEGSYDQDFSAKKGGEYIGLKPDWKFV